MPRGNHDAVHYHGLELPLPCEPIFPGVVVKKRAA